MQITQADSEAVTRAVAEAELKTSGEIVTVVAQESDGYTDVALALSAFVAFTGLVLAPYPPPPPPPPPLEKVASSCHTSCQCACFQRRNWLCSKSVPS